MFATEAGHINESWVGGLLIVKTLVKDLSIVYVDKALLKKISKTETMD